VPDARFAGDLDAPLAPRSLCVEPDCSQPKEGPNHNRRKKDSHFFNSSGPPLLEPLNTRGTKRMTKPAEPPTRQTGSAGDRGAGPSEGQITEEIARSLRLQKIAPHLRVKRIEVKPQFSISSDEELLWADVCVHATLIFASGDDA
jgi:hypothetical protein